MSSEKITVRKLIEILAKKNWDAEVFIDNRMYADTTFGCDVEKASEICSVSSFTSKGNPIVTLNTGR